MILPVLHQFATLELQLRQNWKDEQLLGHCILDLETLSAFFFRQKKSPVAFWLRSVHLHMLALVIFPRDPTPHRSFIGTFIDAWVIFARSSSL